MAETEKEIWTTNDLLFEILQQIQESKEQVQRIAEIFEGMSDHLRALRHSAERVADKR
jgi:hypothetical protein